MASGNRFDCIKLCETGGQSSTRLIDLGVSILKPRETNQPESPVRIPELVPSDGSLVEIITSVGLDRALLVADMHNYAQLAHLPKCESVGRCDEDHIKAIVSQHRFDTVVGVGGCSALDFARACANPGRKVILVPTILSTSCISVNRSVIYSNDEHFSIQTPTPQLVLINPRLIGEGDPVAVAKWSHSGFGDLFSNISAAIDVAASNGIPDIDQVAQLVPDAWNALEWVLNSFRSYDVDTLLRLAKYLHKASVTTIFNQSTRLSAAGEHDLYYAMMRQRHYARVNPTHGELVSIGTLLSSMLFERLGGDGLLYSMLRQAYSKLGLPLSVEELRRIHVEPEHITNAFERGDLPDSFLARHFSKFGRWIFDTCYSAA